ncbi:MAG: 50S ribosomal protein L11 methyltransferase [Bacteroidaceae bacterium]|nr:50S ribosomal protein L11 methyltransferase [Bacteroidaceae bacterium]
MKYLYAEITISPFSEDSADILCALLGDADYDSFETTETGVKAYIQESKFNEDNLKSVLDSFLIPDVKLSYKVEELENKDWNEEWERESYSPILEEEFGIKLNPKMAFGSGSHETTYMLTKYLMSKDFTGKRVLDMGCGTGVLGIAMAKKGAKEVVAIDIDDMSVENAKENFELNSIENVNIILGDASKIEGKYDVIVANIHKNILKNDMKTYVAHLSKDGTLLMSGFYTEDVDELESVAKLCGLSIVDILSNNNWCALVVSK